MKTNPTSSLIFCSRLFFFIAIVCILFQCNIVAQVQFVDEVHLMQNGIPEDLKPDNFAKNDKYLFFRTNIKGQRALWRTDGTNQGLKKLITISTNDKQFAVEYTDDYMSFVEMQTKQAVLNNFLYFTAFKYETGMELWKTNGDTTYLVKDLYDYSNPYPVSSNVCNITAIGNTLYFGTLTGFRDLWKSDGTREGTKLVSTEVLTYPFDVNSSLSQFTESGGIVYFIAQNFFGYFLCKTTGDASSTKMVKIFKKNLPSHLTAYKGSLFFTVKNSEGNEELWRSNGTESSTLPFVKINPIGSSRVKNLCISGDYLYFVAGNELTTRMELYKTDGTTEGTHCVKDINPTGSSSPEQLTDLNGTLYFSALSSSGRELWKSNGTAKGTLQVKDVNIGPADSYIKYMVAINDKIYFSAYRTGYGSELWQSNGTMQGTILIKDLIPGSESSFPTSFIEFKNDIYFSAGIKSANLPQPRNIFQFSPGSNIISAPFVLEEDAKDAFISPIVALGKKLFFTGEDSVHGVELWTSDGIPGSSHMVLDIVNGVNSSFPSNFIIKDSLLYFNAGPTKELWQSNGTPEGTKKVTIPNCPEFGPNNNCIAFPSKNRQKCWVLKNGALYNTNFNGDSVFVDNVNEFGILDKGNDLYYVNVKMNIVTLWKVSCSSNEPIAISKIDTVFLENQYGFFSKKYKILGEFADSNIIVQVHTKTWSINKISGEKHLLSNFIAYTECTDTTNYTVYLCEGGGVNMGTSVLSNGILFYTLGYQSREKPEFWNAYKLWRTDGTKEGTFLLDDRSELNKSLTVFGNGIIYRINFWANSPDPEFGASYVYSNGTKEGTYDIQGYNYKIQNKNFESHVVIENQLYFWGGLIDAKGIYKGAELWKYTLPGNENHRNSFSDDVIELEKSVSVYPNPAEDMLHILTDGSSKVHSAKIFNLAGILVSEQNSEKSNGVSTMKVEALETGLYIIKLLDESGNILLIDKIMVK